MSSVDDKALSRYLTASSPHYTEQPSPHLDCAVCTSTVQDPVVCSSVRHTFCRKCLSDWIEKSVEAEATCPIDREPLVKPLKSAPVMITDLLEDLEVSCSLGCGWQGKEGDRRNHMKESCEVAKEERDRYRSALQNSSADMKRDCRACQAAIFGSAYICMGCRDYSLCAACWDTDRQSAHLETHTFVCIKNPDDIHRRRQAPENVQLRIHPNTVCDGCGIGPIAGPRFKCLQAGCGIDLCEGCLLRGDGEVLNQRTNQPHDPNHAFRRITHPLPPIAFPPVSSFTHEQSQNVATQPRPPSLHRGPSTQAHAQPGGYAHHPAIPQSTRAAFQQLIVPVQPFYTPVLLHSAPATNLNRTHATDWGDAFPPMTPGTGMMQGMAMPGPGPATMAAGAAAMGAGYGAPSTARASPALRQGLQAGHGQSCLTCSAPLANRAHAKCSECPEFVMCLPCARSPRGIPHRSDHRMVISGSMYDPR